MSKRVYAEAMYGSPLWQVVQENLNTGEHSIVKRDLQPSDARRLAEEMQKVAENNTSADIANED